MSLDFPGAIGPGLGYDLSNIDMEGESKDCPKDKIKALKHDVTLTTGVMWGDSPLMPVEIHYDAKVKTWGSSASIGDAFWF